MRLHGNAPASTIEVPPKSSDPRLVVELFAANPDIVHPISIECDAQGRLLVIESHTHFPPPNYQGPKHDRIRMLEDTTGSGKADRITTFFEGTDMTMDIARHPDGSIYVATRNEILRLRDTKGTGRADERQRIVFLETAGRYPHNGLSGLCFDFHGNLYFGIGENLGSDYKLIGSDGATLTGGGEGGNIFWCTADGGKLRRVATGFWNPFGICQDIYGRMFAVDNDPDEMPPCRMLHVVEGGDYGYQFRYGRSGRHIFQAWNGELPGSLPYVTGTGEAPCEVMSYESDGLPSEYLGDLFVASWADHRIERYHLKEQGASYTAEMKPLIQGGKDFRPVGIALAPDGSLFVSDWVLSDYQLHGRGAIWHIRWKDAPKHERAKGPRQALFSLHRPLREAAAKDLLRTGEAGRTFLRSQLHHTNPRVRAAALTALLDGGDANIDLTDTAKNDPVAALRAMAIREMAKRGRNVGAYLENQDAGLRMEAIAGLKDKSALTKLIQLLADKDPFLRHAAIHQLAQAPQMIADIEWTKLTLPQKLGVLLAWRASGHPDGIKRLADFLGDSDEEVLFLAAKWIADEKLSQYRPWLVEHLRDPKLSILLFQAYTTAMARIDNQDVSEAKMAEAFIARLAAESVPPDAKIMAMRLTPASNPKLTIDLLKQLIGVTDAKLRLESVRLLSEHPNNKRFELLRDIAFDSRYDEAVRAQAVVGLAERGQDLANELLQVAGGSNPMLRDEALRDLINVKLTPSQQTALSDLAKRERGTEPLVARVLGRPFFKDRPRPEDQNAWLKRLEGSADPQAGRHVFYHTKLGGCARCHRIDGRGQDIGPDLSNIYKTERRSIVESILQPSNNVAPRYQAWLLEFNDGRVKTGMLHRTVLDDYTYVDEKGVLFKVNTRDLANAKALATSIMPAGLVDQLTDQEFRDLLAFLSSPR
jgi:putative membrane-bound dehydrogenase-like protein